MNARDSEIHLSPETAEALCSLDVIPHVGQVNTNLEEISWLALVLGHVEDDPIVFPRGKWATVQHLQSQLTRAAIAKATEIDAMLAERSKS